MEKTFLMVKPDGVQRNLIGEVVNRFEKKGFKLVGAKFMIISDELAKKHYAEHDGKPFFYDLVDFITSGPVFAMVWEGNEVIKTARHMIGSTNPLEAENGTIRGDFGMVVNRNIIHGSDSLESAQREIDLFFNHDEMFTYTKQDHLWVY